MSKGWAWVSGIFVSLCILGLVFFVHEQRQAYWAHRAVVVRYAQQAQEQHQPDRLMFWRISR
jgi:hypothetical protein